MKTLAYFLMTFFLILCLSGILHSTVEASEYLGEFCWQLAEDGQHRGTLKFGFTYAGNNYFTFQGGTPPEFNGYMAFHGSAQLVGNQLIMLISKTSSDGITPTTNAGIGQCQIVFDLNTLNGSGWCIETSYYPAETVKVQQAYQTQTFTYTQCP